MKKGLLYRGGRAGWVLVGGALVMMYEIARAIEKYLLKVFSLLSGVLEALVGKKAIGSLEIYVFFGISLLSTGSITYHLLNVVSPPPSLFMVVAGLTICIRGLILILKSSADLPPKVT